MLANRLRKNRRRWERWAAKDKVSCYRVYDLDIPEIPLAIDWYEGWLHITEHITKRRIEGPEGDAWLEAMADVAGDALGVEPGRVFVKQRRRQRGRAQYEKLGQAPEYQEAELREPPTPGERLVVQEGGHRFRVNLAGYHDTGLFLDHRATRRMVADEARGKRVLNLFSYTGAFSVYAAAAGARSSTSVDLSRTYLSWARDNLALNGLDQRSHELVRADVLQWLASPERRDVWYDLVVVDPPTFSTSKRMTGTLDVQRDHAALLESVILLVPPGGVVYFSTNRRKFSLAGAAFAGTRVEEITERTVPPDFHARRPHRCWRAVKR
jgi:23S rRNA (cytosine1962-C5)-methyltransferase